MTARNGRVLHPNNETEKCLELESERHLEIMQKSVWHGSRCDLLQRTWKV